MYKNKTLAFAFAYPYIEVIQHLNLVECLGMSRERLPVMLEGGLKENTLLMKHHYATNKTPLCNKPQIHSQNKTPHLIFEYTEFTMIWSSNLAECVGTSRPKLPMILVAGGLKENGLSMMHNHAALHDSMAKTHTLTFMCVHLEAKVIHPQTWQNALHIMGKVVCDVVVRRAERELVINDVPHSRIHNAMDKAQLATSHLCTIKPK